ncbi:MAG: hypothetical protein ACRD2R_05375 [Terriglobales bacterium]
MAVWEQDRIPGERQRHALGLWLTRRKLATAAYMPGQRARRQLRGRAAFWEVFNFNLAANQTLESRVALTTTFIWIATSASTTVGGTAANPGVRVQVVDVKGKKRMMVIGANDICFGGRSNAPMFHRQPYRFRIGNSILVRCQNLQNAAQVAQVVLYGVMD